MNVIVWNAHSGKMYDPLVKTSQGIPCAITIRVISRRSSCGCMKGSPPVKQTLTAAFSSHSTLARKATSWAPSFSASCLQMLGSMAYGVSHGQPGHLMLHPANRTKTVMMPVLGPSPCVLLYISLSLSIAPPRCSVRRSLPNLDVILVVVAERLLDPVPPVPCHVLDCRVHRDLYDAPVVLHLEW